MVLSDTFTSLNPPQNVFCLFFAIFWGLVANAQIRWKAFDWPLAIEGGKYQQSRSRLWRSLFYLTVLPVLLFLVLVSMLYFVPERPFGWRMAIQLAGAVISAHSAFAPYRFWLSAMEHRPDEFYYRSQDICTSDKIYCAQPWDIPDLRLDLFWSRKNLCAAWVYVAVGVVFALIARFLG